MGWVAAFLVAVTALTFAYVNYKAVRPRISPRLERHALAPEFQLTAQDGTRVSNETFKGKTWVANFIFTRCAGPCPLMTSRMAELNQQLKSVKDVQLASFTVDPEYDTPQVLAEYGSRVGAQPDRWKFLTGSKDDIERVVVKGFLQALQKDPAGTLIHSTRFVIVDRDGWMRSFQDGTDPEVVQKLLMDMGDILREPSQGKP